MLHRICRLCSARALLTLVAAALLPSVVLAQGHGSASTQSGRTVELYGGLATVFLDDVESQSEANGVSTISGRVFGPEGIDLYCSIQTNERLPGNLPAAIAAFARMSQTLEHSPIGLPVIDHRSSDRSNDKVLTHYSEWRLETAPDRMNLYGGQNSVFIRQGEMFSIMKDCFLTRDLAQHNPRAQVSNLFSNLWERAQVQYSSESFQPLR